MVICGFPGVGKFSVANNRTNILDAESSGFSWVIDLDHPENGMTRNPAFPGNYIKYLKECADKYEFVLASSHAEVRDRLKMEGIQYIIVAPERDLKNEYLIRYLRRGNQVDFIELLNEKWDEFLDSIENDGAPVIRLGSGVYLADILLREWR